MILTNDWIILGKLRIRNVAVNSVIENFLFSFFSINTASHNLHGQFQSAIKPKSARENFLFSNLTKASVEAFEKYIEKEKLS